MPNSGSDDSHDVGSCKDSQDGSQMLDSLKLQDLVDSHTASVGLNSLYGLVDGLTNPFHRSGLAVAASRLAFAKHKKMDMQHCTVRLRLEKEPTRNICAFTHRPQANALNANRFSTGKQRNVPILKSSKSCSKRRSTSSVRLIRLKMIWSVHLLLYRCNSLRVSKAGWTHYASDQCLSWFEEV